jgi:hypothetical protein
MLEIKIEPTIPVYLTAKQAQQWMMMEFLNSTGALDIKCGRIIIDFDDKGQIGNLKIEQNYKPTKIT